MMRLMFSLLLACLMTSSIYAQREETVFKYTGLTLTGIWGGPSVGFSKLGDDYAYFSGGFGGLEFNNDIFIGWGGGKLKDEISLDKFPDQQLDMRYWGLMLGYAHKSNKAIHPLVNVLIGGGDVELDVEGEDRVFVLQPSAGVEFNIFRWWHLSLEGGYRMIANNNIKGLTNADLSAPFAEVKFRFGFSWGW